MCYYCHNIQIWKKINAPRDYLACLEYIRQLVANGGFELLAEESTCPLNQVKTEDGWADEIMVHMIRCKQFAAAVLSKKAKIEKYACFSKVWTHYGILCSIVRHRTRDGAFIYALSADETSSALAVSRHAITTLFSCRFKCLSPPRRQRHFHSNADRAYNTLHFASKVVCQGASPFGNPGQQNRLNISHFPGA